MMVRVEMCDDILKIVGDTQDNKDLKIIEIPKDEAIMFIERDCQGKIENVLNKLKYSPKEEALYLVSDSIEEGELDFAEFNPEVEKITEKKKDIKKKKSIKNVENKTTLEEGPQKS